MQGFLLFFLYNNFFCNNCSGTFAKGICQAEFSGALKWQLTGKHQIVTKNKKKEIGEQAGGGNQEGEDVYVSERNKIEDPGPVKRSNKKNEVKIMKKSWSSSLAELCYNYWLFTALENMIHSSYSFMITIDEKLL